jgi:hypothetical protein
VGMMQDMWAAREEEEKRRAKHTHLVRWFFQSSQPGLYGWDCSTQGYDTYEEAKAALDDASLRPRGWRHIELLHIYKVEGKKRKLDTIETVRRPRSKK